MQRAAQAGTCAGVTARMVNRRQIYLKQPGGASWEAGDHQAGEQGQDDAGPLNRRHH